jgi:hypothetical protein
MSFMKAMTLARVNCEYVVRFHNAFFEELVMEGERDCTVNSKENNLRFVISFLGKQMFEMFIATEYCNGG